MIHIWVARVRKLGARMAELAVLVGVLGWLGWRADLLVLRNWAAGVEIKANTALCLALLGLATGSTAESGRGARMRELCALGALAIGLATAGEHIVGRSFGIDQLLARDGSAAAGRMAPFTAGAVALLALGALALDLRARGGAHPSELAAAGAGAVGLMALFDGAYGASTLLPTQDATAVALPTAVGLLAVAGALLCARPSRGVMASFTSPRLGGELLRRAVVPVLGLALVEGLAVALGQRLGWLTPAGSLAVMTLGFVLLAAAVLSRTAVLVDRTDAERAEVCAELEARVELRTAGLTAANAQLEQKRAALALARDEALNASRVKSEFLANITHELRTPMGGVIGMVDAVLETPLEASQQQQLRTARSSAAELLAQIDDILDVTALETGQLRLSLAPFEVAKVVQAAVEPSRMRASRLRLQLSSRVQPAVPARLAGDARRIQQVLANLVSNAVKFTRSGLVRVEVTTAPAGEPTPLPTLDAAGNRVEPARIRFTVTDTGPGIAPERRRELFQTFHQLDASTSRAHGGAGLGLAISAQLVELMEGRIGVESTEGVGSTFWFEVPLARAAAQRAVGDGGRIRGLAAAIGPAAVRRTTQVFLDHLDPMVEQIAEAIRAGSPEDLHLATHRLRGSALSFGADRLAALCGELEKHARAGSTSGLAARLDDLAETARDARADVARWLDEVDAEEPPPRLIRPASNA